MNEQRPDIEKSLDYTTFYADGIIFEMGDRGVCRLIVYEKEKVISQDSKALENNQDLKRLKFEIRIPQHTFEYLCENSLYLIKSRNNTLEIAMDKRRDSSIIKSAHELSEELRKILYDTENIQLSNKEYSVIQDKIEDFMGRVNRNSGESKNEQSTEMQ